MARFDQLPAAMLSYATYELAQKLAALTPNQRAAIGRIVQHVYVANLPISELFRGDDKICGETSYYRRGKLDEATGAWRSKPGWGHDVAFQDALSEARRLALQVRSREELTALAEAKRRARLATPGVIDGLKGITEAGEKDSDKVSASKVILDYAGQDADDGDAVASEAADWWEAAEEE